MSDSGDAPTLVGSIKADLDINMADWDRKVAQAKADAAELGALHPTASLDENSGPALQRINDLDKATGQLGEDRKAAAAAADKDTAATDRSTQAKGRGLSMVQALIAASPVLVGGIASVGAAAIGLGAAFGVMAGAGILAVVGIRNEMEQGTAAGNTYAAGIASLKGDLDNLSGTAANGMLSGFNNVVGDINQDMPFLNQTVGIFAGLLGRVGGTALTGVLTGLERMNPLLIEGGAELSNFVTWLFSFTDSNGFTQFINYAIANLPPTMSLVEKLVTLGGNVLAAYAPLGPVLISGLSLLAGVLNSLPLPVLAGVVTQAVLLGPALSFVGSPAITGGIKGLATAIGLVGVSADLAVPVVGVLLAAVAGIGIAMATSAAGTAQATAATADYTTAIQQDNDAIGKHTELMAAKALSDAGAFQAASELGISQRTLTQATLGNADAQQEVADKVAYARRQMDAANQASGGMYDTTTTSTTGQMGFAAAVDKVTGSVGLNRDAIQKGLQQQKDIAAATDTSTGSVNAQGQALTLQAAAYGVSVSAYQAATASQGQVASQLAATTLGMQLQNNAVGLLGLAFDAINGKGLSLAQSDTALAASVNTAAASFQQNGAAIDGSSKAAVANQQAIEASVAAAQAQASATAKSTGATADGVVAYGKSKAALEDQLRAQGALTPAVQAYIDKLYDVNNFHPKPVKLEVDKAAAEADLATFQAHLDGLRDRTVTVTTQTVNDPVGTGSSVGGRANGSLAGGFATGGLIRHLAGGGWSDITGGGPIAGPGSSTSDSVPLYGSAGEYMMKASSVASIGPGNMEYMNRTGQLPPAQGSGQPQQLVMVGTLVMDSGELLGTFRGIAQAEAQHVVKSFDQSSRRYRAGV